MANTLKQTIIWKMIRQGETRPSPLYLEPERTITISGDVETSGVYDVSTTAAAMPVPSGTIGLGLIENRDATNYIQLGFDDSGFVPTDRIPPGGRCEKWFEPTQTWQWKANTAACKARIIINPA